MGISQRLITQRVLVQWLPYPMKEIDTEIESMKVLLINNCNLIQ